jgi:hypothetical protein
MVTSPRRPGRSVGAMRYEAGSLEKSDLLILPQEGRVTRTFLIIRQPPECLRRFEQPFLIDRVAHFGGHIPERRGLPPKLLDGHRKPA